MSKSAISRPFLILCCTAMLGACTPPHPREPFTVLHEKNGFSIISEQHSSEGKDWANYYFRIGSNLHDSETVSKRLFADTDECYNPFYAIWDLRLLPNGGALALLSSSNSHCRFGHTHLAAVDLDPFGQLRVRRIALPSDHTLQNNVFKRPDRQGLGYGYMSHQERLLIQASENAFPVVLETLISKPQQETEGAIAISLAMGEFTLTDLGEGRVLRAPDDDSVLMMQVDRARPPQSIIFKQVRIRSGEITASVKIKPSDYRPASPEAKQSAALHLDQMEMEETVEYEFAVERGIAGSKPRKSKVNDFGARHLPPNALKASSMAVAEILEKESQVEVIDGQIRVKTSPNIRALRLPEQSSLSGAN